ncbi:MAG: hypothetical protein M3295_10110 [Chloroflexota bacterium]|nr:hypothetical protein [Chloroflexota bacterium]
MRGLPLRGIAIGLITYGVVGIVIIVLAVLVTVGAFARLETLSESVGPPVRSTARTLGDASNAFGRFAISLAEAQRSSDDAAQLAHQTADTMAGLAEAMSISIFGTQPFAEAAAGFDQVSNQLDALAGDLESVSDALGNNITDVDRTARNLRDVRDEMDGLVEIVGDSEGASTPGGVRVASLALYALLVWLAIPALMSIVIGVVLLRYARALRSSPFGA